MKLFTKKNLPVSRQYKVCILMIVIFLNITHIATAASQKHIVIIETMPIKAIEIATDSFIKTLQENDYIEGKNLKVSLIKANGNREYATKALKAVLDKTQVDLVVSAATLASQVAYQLLQGRSIPQVFYTVADPVGAGLMASTDKPSGTFITGRLHTVDRHLKITSIVQLLQQQQKKAITFGIVHSSYPSSVGDVRLLNEVAEKIEGVSFVSRQINYRPVPKGLNAMLQASKTPIKDLEPEIDCWWEVTGPLGENSEFFQYRNKVSSKPSCFAITMDAVKAGALITLEPDSAAEGSESAQLALAIFNGADAGKLTVKPPEQFKMGVNISTALSMGITFPSMLIKLSGQHIYH
ncbi:MAG: hypothetical protein HQL46_07130 [Gammaproteobacteria bacterium]|nr:hypothetical protein [Gammaproteobacteria bacterium]